MQAEVQGSDGVAETDTALPAPAEAEAGDTGLSTAVPAAPALPLQPAEPALPPQGADLGPPSETADGGFTAEPAPAEDHGAAEPPPEAPGDTPDGETPAEADVGPEAGASAEAAGTDEGPVGVLPGLPGPPPVPGPPDLAGADDDLVDDFLEIEDPAALPHMESDPGESIRPGSRCKGLVIALSQSHVMVSFGAKIEGQVPLDEFRGDDGELAVEVGQEVEVLVERLGAPGEFASLSHRRVREADAWTVVQEAHAAGLPLKGVVQKRVKGGLRVDLGVSAFMPASQIDVRPVPNLDVWLGAEVEVSILECDRRRGNVVVSRGKLLKAEHERQVAETLASLEVGKPATGIVKNLTTFGAFVDLGGIDGLIKLADLSYGRVDQASNVVKRGEEVTAVVLRIDQERERIGLSLRAMHPDPWIGIEERYAPGQIVRGRVSGVKDYGAFVEIESGVEGLVHSSEIAWSRRPKHPSKTFQVDAETDAVVISVRPSERRISLSYKRLSPDPWIEHAGSLQPGQVLTGTVRRIESYGLFVEIVPGIDGLVHVSDLSWDSRPAHPHEVARKGEEITTVVLRADGENRRLSLGVKQLQPDAWDEFVSETSIGDILPGIVRRIVNFGAFVELAPGIEGLCHSSRLPRDRSSVRPGKRLHFEIVDMNARSRRVGLRCCTESSRDYRR